MKKTIAAIAAATATFASAIGLVTTGGWLISEAALRPQLLVLEVAIVSVRAFGIARGSFRWLERVISHDAALHDTVVERARLWSVLAVAGPRGAWRFRRGDVVTRLMQDAELLQDRVTRVLVPGVAAMITAVGAVVLQISLQSTAGLMFLGAVAIAGGLVPVLLHRIEASAANSALMIRAAMNATLSEFAAHRDELRVLGSIEQTIQDVTRLDDERIAVESRAARLAGVTQFTALVASGLAIVGGLIAAAPAVLNGTLQGPHLAVVALLPWSASEVIAALASSASVFVRVQAARRRIDAIDAVHTTPPPLHQSSGSALDVTDLAVRWDEQAVVNGINFSVFRGEAVAVVGPSGAGKSSVVSALLGLVDYDGTVAVADSSVTRAVAITAVPQAPHVFETTVRENLKLASGTATETELRNALDAVGLNNLGLDRDLSAEPLSGGEAQRLGLARALLTDAPVVVLDEPTEHLDEQTAAEVMHVIRTASRDRALVMTTHRLEDLSTFQRIIVLAQGQQQFSGTFEQAVAQNEWFRESLGWRLDKSVIE